MRDTRPMKCSTSKCPWCLDLPGTFGWILMVFCLIAACKTTGGKAGGTIYQPRVITALSGLGRYSQLLMGRGVRVNAAGEFAENKCP